MLQSSSVLVVRIDQGTQSQRLSWKSVLCYSFEGSHVMGSIHYLTVSDIFPMGLWAVSTVRQTNVLISVLDVRDVHCYPQANLVRLQVRIQDLVKGGAPASEAESCRHSEAESRERSEHSAAGVQGLLKGPGSFWVFDAQICILTHSRDSFSLIFDIYFDTKSW